MDSNLLRTKSIEQLVGDAEHGGKSLKRTLTATDLTLLGIGAIIGTGIFVLTGTAAANQAGPGNVLSYAAFCLANTTCRRCRRRGHAGRARPSELWARGAAGPDCLGPHRRPPRRHLDRRDSGSFR